MVNVVGYNAALLLKLLVKAKAVACSIRSCVVRNGSSHLLGFAAHTLYTANKHA